MSKHRNTAKSGKIYIAGQRITATIRTIHEEGVYVRLPARWNGVVSPKCWGDKEARKKALAALRSGEKLRVVVKSVDIHSRCLSLCLDTKASEKSAIERQGRCSDAKGGNPCRAVAFELNRKSCFEEMKAGSVLLVDTANLLSELGPEDAARKLSVVRDEIERRGYRVLFFLERRALGWCLYSQSSEKLVSEMKEFTSDARVSLVDGESDLAMLQVAAALPNSYCCTRDHFADYADTFGEIVGSRRRSFSSIGFDGRVLLSFEGMRDAIVIESRAAHETCNLPYPVTEEGECVAQGRDEILCDDKKEASSDIASDSVCENSLRRSFAQGLVARGEVDRAVRYLEKVAGKDPNAYYDLADIFAERDSKAVRKYIRLAEDAERRSRKTDIRNRRRLRSARRMNVAVDHLSRQKRKAIGFAEFARVHDEIMGYLHSGQKPCRNVYGRVA